MRFFSSYTYCEVSTQYSVCFIIFFAFAVLLLLSSKNENYKVQIIKSSKQSNTIRGAFLNINLIDYIQGILNVSSDNFDNVKGL